MRKHGLVDPRVILASALALLCLLGMATHRQKHLAPAVIRFEPAMNGSGGSGRSPQPAKRRLFLPPMIA
jgi:hypothetical protein